uniref:Ribonuclease P/MRP 25 subunit-like n=1 Tax=Cynoglossus semilaevis TaxID=244447 RepID=A0A3P8UH14_CYNSE
MENYTKARTAEQPSVCPFPDLAPNTPEVRVKDGSKIRNLLRFALSRMETNALRHEDTIVFTASGKGVSKAITCAEVVKRRVKGLHQLTKLLYSTAVEVWEPLEPDAGLDSLTVNRNLPSIWILLSTAPLDSSQHGYQAPGPGWNHIPSFIGIPRGKCPARLPWSVTKHYQIGWRTVGFCDIQS